MELTKREFLKFSGAAAMFGASHFAFGAAAGGKVRLAAIGTGNQASSDLHNFLGTGMAEIVCAADVWDESLAWVRKEQPGAKLYKDYRQMLKECAGAYDAITIAIPDHLHCVAFLEAAKYGVPVFCEKPLAHTLAETLAMMRVAREKGLITHVGMQGNSDPGTPRLREWVESGELGQVQEAHIYCNAVAFFYKLDPHLIDVPRPVPAGLDWELWQGPAKRRAYFDTAAPGGKWRSWWPYGEGCLTDWVCHIFGPLQQALDLDLPTAVTCDSDVFDVGKSPLAFPLDPKYTFEFAAKGARGPLKVFWYDVDRTAPRPLGLDENEPFTPLDGWAGAWLKCEKETVMYGSHGAGGVRVVPNAHNAKFRQMPAKYPRVNGGHYREFLSAVLERRPTNTPFEIGGKATMVGLLGTIATRFPGRRLEFDGKTMRFTNCPQANAYLKPEWTEAAMSEWGGELRI